jgi:hypothetical protein
MAVIDVLVDGVAFADGLHAVLLVELHDLSRIVGVIVSVAVGRAEALLVDAHRDTAMSLTRTSVAVVAMIVTITVAHVATGATRRADIGR